MNGIKWQKFVFPDCICLNIIHSLKFAANIQNILYNMAYIS